MGGTAAGGVGIKVHRTNPFQLCMNGQAPSRRSGFYINIKINALDRLKRECGAGGFSILLFGCFIGMGP